MGHLQDAVKLTVGQFKQILEPTEPDESREEGEEQEEEET